MKRRFLLRYKVQTFRNFDTEARQLSPGCGSPKNEGGANFEDTTARRNTEIKELPYERQSYVSSELCYVANNRDLPTPEYLEGVYDTSFDNATRLEHSPHGGSCVCVVSTEKQCT